jgi:predicted RNase H-related nuclease YkuK (DUF458 family)
MTIIKRPMDMEAARAFIEQCSPETKFYIGGDSERMKHDGKWYADYTLVLVVHKDGNKGCRVFGAIERELDFDQRKDKPAMRLMNEVIKTANLYLAFADVLEDRPVEIHIDINPDEVHGSSCVLHQAIGYIKGTCNIIPMVKPDSWAATHTADRLKDILNHQKVA